MTPLLFEDRAVIDANALGNAAVADTLLRLAGENAHEVYWSQQILEETKRFQLNRLNWEPHIVASYHVKLAESFPDAVVTDFEPLIAECTNDEGDRHVLAAAIKVGARYVVTFNTDDFQEAALARWGVRALRPDDYFLMLYARDAQRLKDQLGRVSIKKEKPIRWILTRLLRDCPRFAALMLSRLE